MTVGLERMKLSMIFRRRKGREGLRGLGPGLSASKGMQLRFVRKCKQVKNNIPVGGKKESGV